MIDVLGTAQVMLREAKFATRQRFLDATPVLCFEDDSLLGFCTSFTSPQELIDGWQAREIGILRQFAGHFVEAAEKAWNVYSVFLCAAGGDPDDIRQIRWIEENLEHTRKIAACGLTSRENVVQSLLPVLPLQYQPKLLAEDATQRLRARIDMIAPGAADMILNEDAPAVEAARLIGRSA